MLGLRGQPVRIGTDERLRPIAGPCGLAVQSMDFFLQGNQALDWEGADGSGATWRSALEQAALADLIGRTAWGELDCLVIDLAPGADRLPALVPFLTERAVALAVAIPTEVALLAVERSLRRAFEARVPVLGLVENFASAVCGACGAEMALFREADPAARFAAMRRRGDRAHPVRSRARARGGCGPPVRRGSGRERAGRARARGARRSHPLLPWRAGGREHEGCAFGRVRAAARAGGVRRACRRAATPRAQTHRRAGPTTSPTS